MKGETFFVKNNKTNIYSKHKKATEKGLATSILPIGILNVFTKSPPKNTKGKKTIAGTYGQDTPEISTSIIL